MQSFRISRRVFTQSIGAIPIASMLATDADAQSREVTELLAAVTDLIVPRDEGPSASDLKVHARIVANARTIPNYPQLLSEGLGWLEMRAREDHQVRFLALAQDLQADILGEAFAAREMTLPFVFAHRIREDVLSHYYRDARAWVGLGFYGPIQPNGYSDFTDPPA